MLENLANTKPFIMDAARAAEVAELLVDAVDLHCHSGPSVMPRILDHADAALQASEARFKALVYKDHYYPGMAQAVIIEKLYPNLGTRLFSGVALNNAVGGVNPYAVDHCVKLGGKIVWMPTFSAKNHLDQAHTAAKSFPKTGQVMLEPTPLVVTDANGRLTDDALLCLDIIAQGDIILAGGHLHVSELILLFEEAKRRGVQKMMLNHPPYVVGCTDADIRSFVALGAYMEHSVCMFIDNSRVKHWEPSELGRLTRLAGVDHTIMGSDLGLTGAPLPVDGFKAAVSALLDQQFSHDEIRQLFGRNAAKLLNLA